MVTVIVTLFQLVSCHHIDDYFSMLLTEYQFHKHCSCVCAVMSFCDVCMELRINGSLFLNSDTEKWSFGYLSVRGNE